METAHSAGVTNWPGRAEIATSQPGSRGPRQEAKGGKRIAEKFASDA
jgi:hypothetical protein